MTEEQKKLLEPFANKLAEISKDIRQLSDEDLNALIKASQVASWTNCWSYTFRAAQLVLSEARGESQLRASRVGTPQ